MSMKRKASLLIALLFLGTSLYPAAAADPWLDDHEALMKIKDRHEGVRFLLSLRNGENQFRYTGQQLKGLPTGIPLIGHYDPSGYHFFFNDTIVKMSTAMLCRAAPESLIAGLGYRFCGQLLIEKNVTFYFMITEKRQAYDHCNIIFHPIVCQWRGGEQDFNAPIQMGIFDLHGCASAAASNAMAINSFSSQGVNPHDDCLSPDNARINLEGGPYASFWASAHHGNEVFIAFWLVATNAESSTAINRIARESFTLQALLLNLQRLEDPVTTHAADTIQRCLGVEDIRRPDPPPPPADEDPDLAEAIRQSLEEERRKQETAMERERLAASERERIRRQQEEAERQREERQQAELDRQARERAAAARERAAAERRQREERDAAERAQRDYEELMRQAEEESRQRAGARRAREHEAERQQTQDLYAQFNRLKTRFEAIKNRLNQISPP